MSAKENDLLRVQEIYDIVTKTIAQVEELSLSKESFMNPQTTQAALVAEGLSNRVFRVVEEGGKLSEVFEKYGFELHKMNGMRNRLAHAYGTVDMGIVWDVLEIEFPKLRDACEQYCKENGLTLNPSWH